MLQISSEQRHQLDACLSLCLPDNNMIKVFAFGSRTKGTARLFSDLDLALQQGQSTVDTQLIAELKTAFSESDLPFMVDIIDLNAISPEFRHAIKGDLVPIHHSATA